MSNALDKYNIANLKNKSNRTFTYYSISLMKNISGIFTRGFATRENTSFGGSFGEEKFNLTLKKSNILYFSLQQSPKPSVQDGSRI